VWYNWVRLQEGVVQLGASARGCGTTGCVCKWVWHNWVRLQESVVQLGEKQLGSATTQ
jgi:hypothetical protein